MKLSKFPSEWLGLLPFEEALCRQKQAHAATLDGGPGVILGLEHSSIITLGLRGNIDQDIKKSSPLPIVSTDRGGQATLHSPGQLVIYPILPFQREGIGPREYVALLLQRTAETLQKMGVAAFPREDQAGVYTKNGKIAFCGLRLDQGISRHGLSINVHNELDLFEFIRPCGNSQEKIVSIHSEIKNTNVTCHELFRAYCS